jgi:hypothetical protein
MASAGMTYLKQMHQRFEFLATWLPNAKLELGDVGVLDGEAFRQMATLKELGVPFITRQGKAPLDLSYTSASGVALSIKAKGKAAVGTTLPLAKAGVAIKFNKQGAFVFQIARSTVHEIENKAAVGEAIMRLYKQERWKADWGVVDTIVEAGAATILVANSVGAAVELTANTPLEAANLVRLDAGLAVNSQSGDIIQFVAAQGLTPLFKLSRVKSSLIGRLLHGSAAITFGGVSRERPTPISIEEEVFESVAPGA